LKIFVNFSKIKSLTKNMKKFSAIIFGITILLNSCGGQRGENSTVNDKKIPYVQSVGNSTGVTLKIKGISTTSLSD